MEKILQGGFEKVNTDNYRDVKRAMQNTYKKVIVIDDAQYLMANEFMRRATEKGFDKFTEIAQNYWDLQQSITKLPDDVIVYELSHLERDANGNEKAKTIGKMLDEKITLEGMFGIVLKTLIVNSKTKFGVLKIDRSKDEKDLYSLELGDLDSLEGKKRIILKVEEINSTRK